MSELLLNVWCMKKKLKVKYYPMINIEQTDGFIEEKLHRLHRYLKNHI